MRCFSSKHRKHTEKGWDVNLLAQAASGIIMSSTVTWALVSHCTMVMMQVK